MGIILFLKRCALSTAIAVGLLVGAPSIATAEKAIFLAPHGDTKVVDTANKTLPGGSPTTTFMQNGVTFRLFYMDVINNTNYGFDGATTGAPAQARLAEVFAYVADTVNMSGTLNVVIENSINATTGFLAFAGSYFPTGPGSAGYNKPSSLRRLETGTAPFPTLEEIGITVRFGNIPWNLTSSPPTISEYDFSSVMLHEVTHGLGFSSLMSSTGASQFGGGAYTYYDTYLYGNTTTGRLIVGTPTPSYVGTAAERANNPSLMAFDGPLTIADYGSRPGLYAPSPFSGSSFSHWNTGQVTGSPVMEHAITNGEMHRVYESYEIEALKDIGWVNAAASGPKFNFSSATYSVNEAGISVAINVTLDTAPGASIYTVDYDTGIIGDSATNNVDYNNAFNTLSFTGSQVSQSFNIVINNDPTLEGDEIVTLTLSNATGGASLGNIDTAILTIVDDEVDTDGDGLLDSEELILGTLPNNPDSDGDGINDYNEVTNFGNNTIAAYNPGPLPLGTNTDAMDPDTDSDGMTDLTERNFGTDPLDPLDFPVLPASNFMTLGVLLLAISLAGTRLLRKQHS